ncbi:MAG: Rid family detoxifying hydrolase [Natronomonas sp.]|uniref:RidA family protein n=1 Tax=Natronomonas sp. TaxID=2184060 RepID=UPI002870531D|nr:Rid family detoxifying hydrolase [Natronomonas sp.]MDR9381480.1 Rid family detoxifying hydrolase [Natronomonas sp.]MDR9431950.1 Rid family detoxifying hydrolase [Natronomonas sp.]
MEPISTAVGSSDLPFSEAIKHGDTVYVSGQGPIDPESGNVVGETVAEQTTRTLDNVERILEAAGTSTDNIVKITLFVDDMDDYEAINEAYGAFLSEPYPARTAVEVVEHPVDIMIEIDVIAAVA